MDEFIKKLKNEELTKIIDSVPLGGRQQFQKVIDAFPDYDLAFLWLMVYPSEGSEIQRKYIDRGYKKFKKILDSGFPNKLATKDRFESHLWELVLCDVLSGSCDLLPKKKSGVDFFIQAENGQTIQVEAVAPNEAEDEELRSTRPDFKEGEKFFSIGGKIEDAERPVLLRVFDKGFIEKAERKQYDSNKPLIIAINSSKIVGLSSFDEYVLRRLLFGLGYNTITFNPDGTTRSGLVQNPYLISADIGPNVAVFRNPKYRHVSGVIYTSQKSLGFVPGGWSWHNSGITFVPNPLAKYPITNAFPFFKRLLCDEKLYQELPAEKTFNSTIDLS